MHGKNNFDGAAYHSVDVAGIGATIVALLGIYACLLCEAIMPAMTDNVRSVVQLKK